MYVLPTIHFFSEAKKIDYSDNFPCCLKPLRKLSAASYSVSFGSKRKYNNRSQHNILILKRNIHSNNDNLYIRIYKYKFIYTDLQ